MKVQAPNRTLTGDWPHDRPEPGREHRVYVAVTNHCNRSCPWCCTCSSPKGQTWISLADVRASFPEEGPFQVQLEGGEPTLHPELWAMVDAARANPRCTRVVIVTNGVVLPRERSELRAWLARLAEPATIKLSVNHHLLERDDALLLLAQEIQRAFADMGGDRELVLNVRLRKGSPDDDAWVVDRVREAGLLERANVFHLQRYGFAAKREQWEAPFIVGSNFRLVNPDGRVHGPDLVARSEAMRVLP